MKYSAQTSCTWWLRMSTSTSPASTRSPGCTGTSATTPFDDRAGAGSAALVEAHHPDRFQRVGPDHFPHRGRW